MSDHLPVIMKVEILEEANAIAEAKLLVIASRDLDFSRTPIISLDLTVYDGTFKRLSDALTSYYKA